MQGHAKFPLTAQTCIAIIMLKLAFNFSLPRSG
jgi:hypothetical protein